MSMTIDELGTKRWRNERGQLHRENGPAVEWSDRHKEWYLNGKLHRDGGPAVECIDGSKFWWLNDERHREDGPAVEYSDGDKEWYLNGQQLSEYEFIVRTIGNFPEELFEL